MSDQVPEDPPLSRIGADLPPPSHGSQDPGQDSLAKQETAEFENSYYQNTQDDLEAANERRKETTREHFHRLFILGLRIVGISLIAVFVVRILHVVLPDYCQWLSKEQVQEIDRMLFSGAAGGLVIKYLEPILNGNGPKK